MHTPEPQLLNSRPPFTSGTYEISPISKSKGKSKLLAPAAGKLQAIVTTHDVTPTRPRQIPFSPAFPSNSNNHSQFLPRHLGSRGEGSQEQQAKYSRGPAEQSASTSSHTKHSTSSAPMSQVTYQDAAPGYGDISVRHNHRIRLMFIGRIGDATGPIYDEATNDPVSFSLLEGRIRLRASPPETLARIYSGQSGHPDW
ncbi:hypothetical protein CVT26_001798 [Gymnopilus dilepis]|uniref:Uncharacterized protein n=1 Tax=Gymnopilus dilepis TaxID=231916 RepID=A0A409Y430_9AGAR|nr:hypothetical protein CVT26_001798 [Gymnopilus dilepis]